MRIFSIFLFSVLLFSCASSSKVSSVSDAQWFLESIGGEKVEYQNSERQVYIRFDKATGKISGMAGCNRFFGTYTQNGENISFSELGMTRLSCPDMEIEARFKDVMSKANKASIKGTKLTLKQDKNILAEFYVGAVWHTK